MASLGFVIALVTLAAETKATLVAPPLTKVAMLEIKATDVEPNVAKNLAELFAVEAGKVPGYSVISQQEILDVLGFEAQKQALGCDEASCFTELGGALGVDLIVAGSVGKVGETFVVSLRLIDIKRVSTKNRVGDSIAGKVELLPDYMRIAAWRLLGVDAPQALLADYEKTKLRLEPKPVDQAMAVAPVATPATTVADARPSAAPPEEKALRAAPNLAAQAAGGPVAPAKAPTKPWTWQRIGKTAFGLGAAVGLFVGGTYHLMSYLRSEGEDIAEGVPGFGGTGDDLRGRAFVGYGIGAVGIAGAIVFALLEPSDTMTPSVTPTANGVAFHF